MKTISLAGREIAIAAIERLVEIDKMQHEDGENIIAMLQRLPIEDDDEGSPAENDHSSQ